MDESKLKTLKDFKCCGIWCGEKEGELPHAIETANLRKEAIKWVKELREDYNKSKSRRIKDANTGAINTLYLFFNLTEEDFK